MFPVKSRRVVVGIEMKACKQDIARAGAAGKLSRVKVNLLGFPDPCRRLVNGADAVERITHVGL